MGGVKDQDLVSWGLDYDPNKRSLIRDHMLLLKTGAGKILSFLSFKFTKVNYLIKDSL